MLTTRTAVVVLLLCGFLTQGLAAARKPAAKAYAGDLKLYEPRKFTDKGGQIIQYHLMKPVDFDETKSYPLLLFLHGMGGCGSNNRKNLTDAGVPKIFADERLRKKYPAFVLVPQCTRGSAWAGTIGLRRMGSMETRVIGMLEAFCKEFKVDTSRIYITGLSLGGFGTFGMVSGRPDIFAAAAPVCGGWPRVKNAKAMAQVPFWIFHGGADKVVNPQLSRNMQLVLKQAGGQAKLTEYPGVGHNSWTKAYNTPELWQWLFAQKRPARKKTGKISR